MKKTIAILCGLLLMAGITAAGLAETGEDGIHEELYVSGYGFSFLYADEWLEIDEGAEYTYDKDEGVMIYGPDAWMEINPVSRELAEDLLDEYEVSYDLDEPFAVIPLYDGEWSDHAGRFFDKLVVVDGQYVYAFARYPDEQEEGVYGLFCRLLNTVSFSGGIPIRAEWGMAGPEEDTVYVYLRAEETVWNVRLLRLDWDEDGDFTCTAETMETWAELEAGAELSLELEFIGMMPENGIAYTDAEGTGHVCALDISGEDGGLYLWSLEDYLK